MKNVLYPYRPGFFHYEIMVAYVLIAFTITVSAVTHRYLVLFHGPCYGVKIWSATSEIIECNGTLFSEII